jgi:FkbM family methyltransferase
MRIRDRAVGRILKAPFERRHYVAVRNMAGVCEGVTHFADTFRRYLLAAGSYPHRVHLRTPAGVVSPTLYSYHDMLTVNEIFFREDYRSRAPLRVVVDIGANIGISALYFLSRNSESRCYLFEPVPANVAKLRQTLAGYEARYVLHEAAMGTTAGVFDFGVESTGRYGGLGRPTGNMIQVPCEAINDALAGILAVEGSIDVLKIDTEGTERELVEAIRPEIRGRIGQIFIEAEEGHVLGLAPAGAS